MHAGKIPENMTELNAFVIILSSGIVIFYSSYFLLHYFAKKPIRFLWLAAFYVVFACAYIIIQSNFSDLLLFCVSLLYFNFFGLLFRTFFEWIKDRKIKAELEIDKIASQLELLKSQINPHFLFNTLNNIDVLILDEPQQASDYLKKLSEILRFMLYETNSERVPLSKEIEYIKKYIELQKIRTLNNKFVEFEITGETKDKFIAPMIFLHFIENAFKYSTNKKIENAISIRFDISENRILFFCKNHNIISRDTNPDKNGLGIQLIKQKLDLIYKKAYNLNVKEENNWYIVNLEIQLNDH
jgi:LytS/YehU family sensor histidine kinase